MKFRLSMECLEARETPSGSIPMDPVSPIQELPSPPPDPAPPTTDPIIDPNY
jgi:hypothetical protein